MADVVWAAPAIADLEAIAEYIAVENPSAAAAMGRRVYEHVGQLEQHPESGSHPAELRRSRYRQIVEPPVPRSLSIRRLEGLRGVGDPRPRATAAAARDRDRDGPR